jgi:seryl-tRNA synthetase
LSNKSQTFLKFAFLDRKNPRVIKFKLCYKLHLLENQEKVIQALAKGIWTPKYCGRCHKLDTERRATQVELDGILAESNKLSKDIGEMMKNGENRKPLS